MVTNSIEIAYTVPARNSNRVYMAGGRLGDADGAALGPTAVDFVEQFTDYSKFDSKSFVSVCGFEAIDRIITSSNPPENIQQVLEEASTLIQVV